MPSYTTKCSVCKEDKFVNANAYKSRVAKYGSVEEIEAKWICRECAQLHRAEMLGKKEEAKAAKKATKKPVGKGRALGEAGEPIEKE